MRKLSVSKLSLIFATSTAATAVLSVLTWNGVSNTLPFDPAARASVPSHLLLADDNEHKGKRRNHLHRQSQSDDDGEDEDGSCSDNDHDKSDCSGGKSPAQAGTVAPPANGLFEKGTRPKVDVQ